ncbi:MAG: ResB protein required for cytochrome C biosynthesis [Isosphaera sp.]|nr:ResB protein required for cytochrome C biosynthesis [Isosphaera sp.]
MSTPAADPVAPPGGPRQRPPLGPLGYALKGLRALASLQLTVVLFALSIGLVFFGTVAQVDYGIWTVVDEYFWSWVVWVPFDVLLKFGQVFFDLPPDATWGGAFPFPGGKLLGGLMLLNLVAAHLVRFRLTWKRSGVLILHSGVILLFVGEFVTREFAVEQRMTIDQGESVNYAEDARLCELAFVTPAGPGRPERVTAVPESRLRKGNGRVTHPDLPVDVEVVEFMPNSALEKAGGRDNPATAGAGLTTLLGRRREVAGADTDQKVDMRSAYVTLYRKGTDEPVGTYATSVMLSEQRVAVDGQAFDLALRFRRYPKPYTIHLVEFRHDKYLGTEKAKNFSSKVVVLDPENGVEREVVISMNDPLRYRGETFYQGGFDPRTGTTTILQVVRNPGWVLPYVSCVVVTLGMLVHFGIHLTQFLRRRAAA